MIIAISVQKINQIIGSKKKKKKKTKIFELIKIKVSYKTCYVLNRFNCLVSVILAASNLSSQKFITSFGIWLISSLMRPFSWGTVRRFADFRGARSPPVKGYSRGRVGGKAMPTRDSHVGQSWATAYRGFMQCVGNASVHRSVYLLPFKSPPPPLPLPSASIYSFPRMKLGISSDGSTDVVAQPARIARILKYRVGFKRLNNFSWRSVGSFVLHMYKTIDTIDSSFLLFSRRREENPTRSV